MLSFEVLPLPHTTTTAAPFSLRDKPPVHPHWDRSMCNEMNVMHLEFRNSGFNKHTTTLRKRRVQFLRINNRFPSMDEIGTIQCHIRHKQRSQRHVRREIKHVPLPNFLIATWMCSVAGCPGVTGAIMAGGTKI
uniref:Uncharacterized protein n=1 Tax=Proboscia inermis TaxID=420281 RepID=A0A7S0C7I0_9STRA